VSETINTWDVMGVKIDSCQKYGRSRELVIEAKPSYGNAKKGKGEFRFALTPVQFDDLKKSLDDASHKATRATSETLSFRECVQCPSATSARQRQRRSVRSGPAPRHFEIYVTTRSPRPYPLDQAVSKSQKNDIQEISADRY
jgi:hypothetical protein